MPSLDDVGVLKFQTEGHMASVRAYELGHGMCNEISSQNVQASLPVFCLTQIPFGFEVVTRVGRNSDAPNPGG